MTRQDCSFVEFTDDFKKDPKGSSRKEMREKALTPRRGSSEACSSKQWSFAKLVKFSIILGMPIKGLEKEILALL